MSNLTQT